jgi:hypothetical protein
MLSGKSTAWYRKEPAWVSATAMAAASHCKAPRRLAATAWSQILKFQMGGNRVVDVENQPQTISHVASFSQEGFLLVSRGRRHRDKGLGGHSRFR